MSANAPIAASVEDVCSFYDGRGARRARSVLERAAPCVMLLAAACGLGALGLLIRAFCEVPFAPASAVWGFATLALVWGTSAFARGRGWIGALAGATATVLGAWFARGELVPQLAAAWESACSWTLPEGSVDTVAAVGFALLGVVVGLLVFSWHIGLTVTLAGAVLLVLCPLEGVEPGPLPACLLLAYTAACLAHARGHRAFGERPQVVAVALAACLASLAPTVPLVLYAPQLLEAPANLVEQAVERLQGAFRQPERAQQPAAAPTLDRSGEVSRSDLESPSDQPLVDVVLSRRPSGTLYLPYFRGGAYGQDRWEAAGEPQPSDLEGIAVLLDGKTASEALEAASYVAASASVPPEAQAPLGVQVVAQTSGLDARVLQPYASLPVEEAGGHAFSAQDATFAAAPFGTYDELCAVGALDPAQPVGALPAATTARTALAQAAGQLLRAYEPQAAALYLAVPADELPRLGALVASNPQATVGDAVAFVRQTLAANATYTTVPGGFPSGTAIPEYLLFEGHRGYCQHFATTAALMLRMYGIPTRYVTGLAAPADAFAETANGPWQAALGSARAHAWVEIYTAELGWVPVEVTPGDAAEAAPYLAVDPANNHAGAQAPQNAPDEARQEPGEDAEPVEESPADDLEQEPQGPDANSQAPQESASPQAPDQPAEEDPGAEDGTDAPQTPEQPEPDEPEDVQRPLPQLPLAAIVGALVAVGATAAGSALARHRRKVIVERRRSAAADGLLAEVVEVLHFGGLLEECTGTEDDFAARLVQTVPALRPPQVQRLIQKALEAAFGPAEAPRAAVDASDLAVYDAAVDAVYGSLGPWRRLVFTWVRAFR